MVTSQEMRAHLFICWLERARWALSPSRCVHVCTHLCVHWRISAVVCVVCGVCMCEWMHADIPTQLSTTYFCKQTCSHMYSRVPNGTPANLLGVIELIEIEWGEQISALSWRTQEGGKRGERKSKEEEKMRIEWKKSWTKWQIRRVWRQNIKIGKEGELETNSRVMKNGIRNKHKDNISKEYEDHNKREKAKWWDDLWCDEMQCDERRSRHVAVLADSSLTPAEQTLQALEYVKCHMAAQSSTHISHTQKHRGSFIKTAHMGSTFVFL